MITKQEIELFTTLPNLEVVFDVGARTDLDYLMIRPEAEYHLFEPHLEFAFELKKKLRALRQQGQHLNVKVNEFGLGSMSGEKIYYEFAQSFVNERTDTMDQHYYPVRTLDEYCITNKIYEIDFLKIDAEGMDYQVLLGAARMLPNIKHIQFESHDSIDKFRVLLKDFDITLIDDVNYYAKN